MIKYGTGADKSPFDLRTFAYIPSGVPQKGGTKYTSTDIENQYKVGICTAISKTQNARKALKKKFSADFQYLLQKKYVDGNWNEGSSISSALKVGQKYGYLPENEWTFTKESDRKLSYDKYITKLKNVTDADIERLLKIASKYKLLAYAKVDVTREDMANAINESKSGILVRFDIGNEWYRQPIEPLRKPKEPISGHAITECNYDGGSFRTANTWGSDWADKGTAYHILSDYAPTEAWIPYYEELPEVITDQIDSKNSSLGKIIELLQQVVKLYQKINLLNGK